MYRTRVRPPMSSLLESALVLATLISMGGGCKSDGDSSDGGIDAKSGRSVVSISLSYPFSRDAAVPVTSVTIDASGSATCSGTDSAGVLSRGQLPAADATIPDLLSRPGLVDDLATWCAVNHSDAGPFLAIRFAGEDAVFSRLVDSTCTNGNLDALVRAIVMVGDACMAAATVHFNPPDGGNHGGVYDLAAGPACYRVGSVRDVLDGCGSHLADIQGQSVQGSYDPSTATFLLGDQGAFGQGLLGNNYGVLVHEAAGIDPTVEGCTWRQRDDVTITVTGTYTFTASVVEQRTSISPARGAPASECTSSWTWIMWADSTKSAANNCR
jgi:hypothetical protein